MAKELVDGIFCPVCRSPVTQRDIAVFVEVGEYDDAEGAFQEEGDVSAYQCTNKDCNQEFYM
jgi:hypothetical protein